MLSRRIVLAFPLFGQLAFAQTKLSSFKIGAMELTVFSDGVFTLPIQLAYPTLKQEELAQLALGATQVMNVNIALVKTGKDLIVIDTGGGYNFLSTLGGLPKKLETAGISLESVTKVILTHGHADHLWGTLDEFNTLTFPNATHFIHPLERDSLLASDYIANAGESSKNLATGSQRILKTLLPKLETALPSQKIADGVSYVETFGHTKGHCSVLLESGKERLMITGDAINSSILSFSHPHLDWGMDNDKVMGTASRKRLLSLLETEKMPLLGYHFPDNGLGRVEKAGTYYKFTPF